MKRIVMQLMRSVVTVVVVGTLAMMVFSLRGELAQARSALDARAEAARPTRSATVSLCPAVPKAARTSDDPGLFETVRDRTSVRKFDPLRDVSTADEEKILRAAMCAPSAMNKQPWEFVVVRDPAKLQALGSELPYSRVGNGARMAIVVCGNLDNGLSGRGKEYWIQDCSAASMNILLAAKALGLGAVWTGVYPGEDRVAAVRKIVGIPEGYMPLNVIPIGYPAENPQPKDKWNAKKVHRDTW